MANPWTELFEFIDARLSPLTEEECDNLVAKIREEQAVK